jgi:protein tyrosine/serine phosphatase
MIVGLVPIRNFAIVDEQRGLYRSAQPIYNYEYKWLKNLGIKTIVNLRAESDLDNRRATSLGIEVVNIRVRDHFIPTIEQVQVFIDTLKDETKYPLIFHCQHGHGRTSTFCMLARMVMGWNHEEALKEENETYQYNFKYQPQIDFLKEVFLNNIVNH